MNEIASLGVILLLALLAGHVAKLVRVPEVTGYILGGVVLGPSVLGWVGPENLHALQTLSDIAEETCDFRLWILALSGLTVLTRWQSRHEEHVRGCSAAGPSWLKSRQVES